MAATDPDVRYDEAAGPLVRPYAVAGGRVQPATEFDLITVVMSTGRPLGELGPEHAQILRVCRGPVSVAEVSARVHLPVAVIKILLADLLGWHAIVTRAPIPMPETSRLDRQVLQEVLDGLRNTL